MAPVYLYGGGVLLRDGSVAVSETCCCGGPVACPCYCQIANPQPALCFQVSAPVMAIVCNNANPTLSGTIPFQTKIIAGGMCHFIWTAQVPTCTWDDGYTNYQTTVVIDVSCLPSGQWRVSVLIYNPYLDEDEYLEGFRDVDICVDGDPAYLHGTVTDIDVGPNPNPPPARLLVSVTFNTPC